MNQEIYYTHSNGVTPYTGVITPRGVEVYDTCDQDYCDCEVVLFTIYHPERVFLGEDQQDSGNIHANVQAACINDS